MSRAIHDNDPPLTIQEALLDTLGEWGSRIPYSHRAQLAAAITRICIDQHVTEMNRLRAADQRAAFRPGRPIERASLLVDAEGRN